MSPGSANQKSKKRATLKIQVVYDLLVSASLISRSRALEEPTRRPQPTSFQSPNPEIGLRDLGYFSTLTFKKLLDQGVDFLSRLKHKVSIRDPQTLKPIDLLEILRRDGRFDRQVMLGAEHMVPLRLVALPVPEQVANERRRKAKTNRDKRLNPSKDHLELMAWNIFVTSVHQASGAPNSPAGLSSSLAYRDHF